MSIANRFTPIPKHGQQSKETIAMAQNIELLMGARGDRLDSALTWRDLAALGYIKFPKSTTSKELALNSVPTLPSGVESVPAIEAPTKPTGVVAASAQVQTIIAWDKPRFYGFAYTEVWRSSVDDYGTAARVGTSSIAMYSDVHNGETYYYWARHVNILDAIGPLHATAGATPSGTIDDIAGTLDVTQVGALAADRIFAASGSIADLIVGEGHILNAMIGQVIQSDNYVPGAAGWTINKDGSAEFRNGYFRGDIYSTNAYVRGNIEATSIKANVVNVIDTWMLKGQSVILPASYYRAASFDIYRENHSPGGYSSWVHIGGRSIDFGKATSQSVILVDIRFVMQGGTYGSDTLATSSKWFPEIRLKQGGSVVRTWSRNELFGAFSEGKEFALPFSKLFPAQPGAGTFTYSVEGRITDSNNVFDELYCSVYDFSLSLTGGQR